MKRPIVLALGLSLLTAGAVAGNPGWRAAALNELRSIAQPLFEQGDATETRFDAFYAAMVEELPPARRGERALEMAINGYDGAAEYVIQNAASWRGNVDGTEQLATLLNLAQNSRKIEVRMAGFELQLAQNGLEKSSAEVARLQQRLDTDPARSGPWALWNLGTLGARGVERERIFALLVGESRHPDQELRHWAVEGLARLGGTEVIAPLLAVAAGDASMVVRERAFCALAQSGTLQVAERYDAVPGLLTIAEDPAANQQVRDWSFQALREITGLYQLPDDPRRWRDEVNRVGLLQVAR